MSPLMIPKQLKLSYFNIQGPAEKIRLALTIGKIPFVDRRVEFSDWPNVKPTTPYGKMPVLEINDGEEVITQSDALMRYAGLLANQNGVDLYPQEGMERTKCDEMIAFVDEIQDSWAPRLYVGMNPKYFGYPEEDSFKGTDEHKRVTELARSRWVAQELPSYLEILTKRFETRKFLCGDSVTIADCYLVPLLNRFSSGSIDHVPADCLKQSPAVCAYVERFMSIPEVAKWYASAA